MSLISENINNLIDDIIRNPDKAITVDASDEAIQNAKKKINFYGLVIPAEESHINISVVNWRDLYLRNLLITALVGYLHRAAAEYCDDAEVKTKCPENLFQMLYTENSGEKIKIDRLSADTIYRKTIDGEIIKFIERSFKYNPDIHARSAYKENTEDPERIHSHEKFRKLMENANTKDSADSQTAAQLMDGFREKLSAEDFAKVSPLLAELSDKFNALYSVSSELATETKLLRQNLEGTFASTKYSNAIWSLAKHISGIEEIQRSPEEAAFIEIFKNNAVVDGSDLEVMLSRSEITFKNAHITSAKHIMNNFSNLETILATRLPADTFHHFDRYLTNHYEQIREATNVLYCTKPDIEFGIQYYERAYDNLEEAELARKKIESKLSTAVFSISNEGWSLLGPFKKNRERIEFYNKNTEIIKKMLDQAGNDQKLGEDIMKKRVKVKKAENVALTGEDAKGLEQYKEALGIIDQFGSKESTLSTEEKEKLAAARRTKEMAEVPEGAIQVDTFRTDETGKLVKGKFYTEASAPVFMEDNLDEQNYAMKLIKEGNPPELAWARAKDYIKQKANSRKLKSRDGKTTTIADLQKTTAELKDNIN